MSVRNNRVTSSSPCSADSQDQLPVDLAPVADIDHDDDQDVVSWHVDDPVVPEADTVMPGAVRQSLAAGWPRVLKKLADDPASA